MQNVQHRIIDAPARELGALLNQASTPDDNLWPSPAWPPLVLDAGLIPASRGGHGPMRYSVTEYEPGRRLRFAFAPGSGLSGYHELVITEEGPERCRLTHAIVAKAEGRMMLLWPLVVRWLHEALLEDLLDNAELAAVGRLRQGPARWSPWVRALRRARGVATARQDRFPRTGSLGPVP